MYVFTSVYAKLHIQPNEGSFLCFWERVLAGGLGASPQGVRPNTYSKQNIVER